ncbi:MAG: hypothetical protein HC905_17045 [Bacteroidales bacterium]|nr:hypothetical protein [Bacteroidales bacterium]
MKRLNYHISIVIFFHLLVFIAPMMIKAFHQHHTLAQCKHESDLVVLSEYTNEFCPICEYEFSVNDLPKSPNISYFGFLYTKLIIVATQAGYISANENLISPRAPPVIA